MENNKLDAIAEWAGRKLAHIRLPKRKKITQAEPDKRDAGHQTGETDGQSQPISPSLVPPVQPAIDTSKAEKGEAEGKHERQPPKRRRRSRRRRYFSEAISALTFLATVALAIFAYYQWRVSKGMLDSMASSSNQTQQMIHETQRLANTSENTSAHFKDIADATNKQADASVISANAATTQANASQTQANASVAQSEAAKNLVAATQTSAGAAAKSAAIATESARPYVVAETGMHTRDAGTYVIVFYFNNGGNSPTTVTVEWEIITGIGERKVISGTIPTFTLAPRQQDQREITSIPSALVDAALQDKGQIIVRMSGRYTGLGGPYTLDMCETFDMKRFPNHLGWTPCNPTEVDARD